MENRILQLAEAPLVQVMPFGSCNSIVTSHLFINDTLFDFLNIFLIAFINRILVFSDTLDEHQSHLQQVMECLKGADLFIESSMNQIHIQETTFLILIITSGSIRMDPIKVNDNQDQDTPASIKDVEEFIKYANFYRQFILGFSSIYTPMTALTRKNIKFSRTLVSRCCHYTYF